MVRLIAVIETPVSNGRWNGIEFRNPVTLKVLLFRNTTRNSVNGRKIKISMKITIMRIWWWGHPFLPLLEAGRLAFPE